MTARKTPGFHANVTEGQMCLYGTVQDEKLEGPSNFPVYRGIGGLWEGGWWDTAGAGPFANLGTWDEGLPLCCTPGTQEQP